MTTKPTTTTYKRVKPIKKMNKTIDISHFLNKTHTQTGEISTINNVNDPEIKLGLIKTLIMAGNGSFELVRAHFGYALVNKTPDFNGLGDMYPSLTDAVIINDNPRPKLPLKALIATIEWYRDITLKTGKEAQLVFYHNASGQTTITIDDKEVTILDIEGVYDWGNGIFSYTPKQHNSAALTEVAASDIYYQAFNNTFGHYIETHSHNSMSAFDSGTDDANSLNEGIQLVFGHLNTSNIQMYTWATSAEVIKTGLNVDEINKFIELPAFNYDDATNMFTFQLENIEPTFDKFYNTQNWDDQVIERPRTVYRNNISNTSTRYYQDSIWGYNNQQSNYYYDMTSDDYWKGYQPTSNRKRQSSYYYDFDNDDYWKGYQSASNRKHQTKNNHQKSTTETTNAVNKAILALQQHIDAYVNETDQYEPAFSLADVIDLFTIIYNNQYKHYSHLSRYNLKSKRLLEEMIQTLQPYLNYYSDDFIQ